MTDEPPSSQQESKNSWLEKILKGFSQEPSSREEILDILKTAVENEIVDQEALDIMEGALGVSNQQVREIMISRANMVYIREDDSPAEFLPKVIESGHSRFPVIGESVDDVKGILLAKDLLPLILNGSDDFNLSGMLRIANIIPESKRLNVLLKEFRENRYHMAMVIDEYGGISGLVTIEDILEEIVGEIEDETDEDEEDFIRAVSDDEFIIKALTPIDDFNDTFGAKFSDLEFDTIGGIVTQAFGHMPVRNEVITVDGFTFRVLHADSRRLHLLRLTQATPEE